MPVADYLGFDPKFVPQGGYASKGGDKGACVIHRFADYTERGYHASTKCGWRSSAEIHTLHARRISDGEREFLTEVSRRLRIAVIAIAKPANAIAEEVGVSAQAFSNYLTGYRPPDVYAMSRLATAYGVTLDYIYRGSFDGVTTMMASKLREAEAIYDASLASSG